MKTLLRISLFLALSAVACFAQLYTLSNTTITPAITANQDRFAIVSVTGMTVESATAGTAGTELYVTDEQGPGEAMIVTQLDATNLIVQVRRGAQGTKAVAHLAGAYVYYGAQNLFYATDAQGSCTLANTLVSPYINVLAGNPWTCTNSRWVQNADATFFVPPTSCTGAPTTLTQTTTYPLMGASSVPAVKMISNAVAGTLTVVCTIVVPSSVTAMRGAILTDITLFLASSATGSGVVPTSVGTATLGTITLPTPATTETASTVTPVTIGGTATSIGAAATAFLAAVTTDGSWYSIKTTFSTVVDLSTDFRILVFTYPVLQSAASVVTNLSSPGLLVHYARQR